MKRILLVVPIIVLAAMMMACGVSPTPVPPHDNKLADTQTDQTQQLSDEARAAASQWGYAVEPWELAERIKRDNSPAHVMYLYVVSPFTGEIISQYTSVGKPASTTKRLDEPQKYELSPEHDCGEYDCQTYLLYDRIGADGAYGPSTEGIVWFDTSGQMMEMKTTSSAIIIYGERPMIFKNNKIDLSVDIRLQGQIDPVKDATRVRIEKWIESTKGTQNVWHPGDAIPLNVIEGDK